MGNGPTNSVDPTGNYLYMPGDTAQAQAGIDALTSRLAGDRAAMMRMGAEDFPQINMQAVSGYNGGYGMKLFTIKSDTISGDTLEALSSYEQMQNGADGQRMAEVLGSIGSARTDYLLKAGVNGEILYYGSSNVHSLPHEVAEFGKGFLYGAASGGLDTLAGPFKMAWSLLVHPVDTATQMINGVKGLIDNVINGDFKEIAKSVAPQIYELATEWSSLSQYRKGELTGELAGQYGAGLLSGAITAKIISKLKAAKAANATNHAPTKSPPHNTSPCSEWPNCFPAGTWVAVEDGLEPIEAIREGDQVWAFDHEKGQWQLRRVLATFAQVHTAEFVTITVAGETIESTSHHPFWVAAGEGLDDRPWPEHVPETPDDSRITGRWVDADDLRVGDLLFLQNGRQCPITSKSVRQDCRPVYNFHVEELQCYAVGANRVLVHNNCAAPPPYPESFPVSGGTGLTGDFPVTDRLPGAKGTFGDAIAAQNAKLEEIAGYSGKQRNKISTVTGAVNKHTGETTVGIKRSGQNYGKCAEDLCVEQLGCDAKDVLFSRTIRPRTNEFKDVCKRCQTKYTRDQFAPGTLFEE